MKKVFVLSVAFCFACSLFAQFATDQFTVRIATLNAVEVSDELYIAAADTVPDEYAIGKDVAKMFISESNIAQLWVNAYGSKLSVNTAKLVNGDATFNLSLYAPSYGQYELTLEENPIDGTTLLLYHGAVLVDTMSTDKYIVTLSKGENTEYSIHLKTNYKPIPFEICHQYGALQITGYTGKVIVRNAAGTEVINETVSTSYAEISLADLPSGRYTVEMNSGAKVFTIMIP